MGPLGISDSGSVRPAVLGAFPASVIGSAGRTQTDFPSNVKLWRCRMRLVTDTRTRRHMMLGSNFRPVVLVTDDQAICRAMLRARLEAAGMDVVEAEDGSMVKDLCLDHSPVMVFMDFDMPIMDGLDATHALRAEGFMGPIIGFTANASSNRRSTGLRAGMDRVFGKHIGSEDLQNLVSLARRWHAKQAERVWHAPWSKTAQA